MVSRALEKPCNTLKPETLAVIDPKLTAARALVDRCPIEMTETTTREYSRRWVLRSYSYMVFFKNNQVDVPKDWQGVLGEDAKFLPEHGHAGTTIRRYISIYFFFNSGDEWRKEWSIFGWWSTGFRVSLRIDIDDGDCRVKRTEIRGDGKAFSASDGSWVSSGGR